MISLTNYSSRKILAEQKDEPPVIDYRKEAVLNPVKAKWEWMFKGGSGNLIKTTIGRVVVRNCEGEPIRVIKFDGKTKRNNTVVRMVNSYKSKKGYTVNVEFD